MPATFEPTPLSGVVLVRPRVFTDDRGTFFESYKDSEYTANGITGPFLQDNHSTSTRGVLRGLHFQRNPHAQGKLVRVVRGRVWDVAVDLRPGSPSLGRWWGCELSAENRLQLYIPAGFAHGFLTLSDEAEFCYKCTAEYEKASEGGVRWDDPDLAVGWPLEGLSVTISEKDAALPSWKQIGAPE